MELGLVAQKGNERATTLAASIVDALEDDDVTVMLDEATAGVTGREGVPVSVMADCALVVSVGGDGTFLYAARHAGTTPILGVNLGEVGFLNAVSPEAAVEAVHEEVDLVRERGEPRFREVTRLVARGEAWSLPPALNEIGIFAPLRGHRPGLDIEVVLDGASYVETRADGTLVVTPTGSTAYNLAEDGPLVHPDVAALVVTPMSPAVPTPPLVVDEAATVTVYVSGTDHAVVASDGSARTRVATPCTVDIECHPDPARIAGPPSDFFRALEKLERPGNHER